MRPSSDVAFSEAVKRIQRERGSRHAYERMERLKGGFRTEISSDLASFIAARDSFYIATSSAEGQPYVQHRGGPPGFVKVLNATTLGFADFSGNKQYITTGNLAENGRAFLFLMDYAERRRVKLWGHARVVTGDESLLAELASVGYGARIEQAIMFTVTAWDENCDQHIPRLIPEETVERTVAAMRERIDHLEAQLRAR